MSREIPKYRALEKLSIRAPNDRQPREIYAGQELEFDGRPGPALLPLNGAARANKARAIVAGPGPHRPVEPLRQARSLGYAGHDPDEAKAFINDFVAREVSRQSAAPPTPGK